MRFLDPARAVGAAGVRAGVIGAALADLAAAVDGDLPGLFRDQAQRRLLPLGQHPPGRVDHLIAGPGGELIQARDQVVAGPGPSTVIISRRRKPGGSAPIAASTRAMWSAAVFDPAEPRRSIHASGSPPVLSHTASSG